MGILLDDPLYERFDTPALSHTLYGGADFGECFVTAKQITPADSKVIDVSSLCSSRHSNTRPARHSQSKVEMCKLWNCDAPRLASCAPCHTD